MSVSEPFHFRTEWHLVELTGLSARTLQHLLNTMREVPGSSIFHHTHEKFLAHHFETPVVYSDFARWVGDALREDALAEKLATIDMLSFTSIRQIRNAIIRMIEDYLRTIHGRSRECPPGEEFHFCKTKSFVTALGITASDVADFFSKLAAITNNSLYFHLVGARLRLEVPTNDFSRWLAGCGRMDLAKGIEALDPYACSLDELKADIIELGRKNGVR